MWSTTRISTGPLATSSLSPNVFRMAVKNAVSAETLSSPCP
jgi:hypothetical protein